MKLEIGTKLVAKKTMRMGVRIAYEEDKEYTIEDIQDGLYVIPNPGIGSGVFDKKELLKCFKVVGQKTFKERIFGGN